MTQVTFGYTGGNQTFVVPVGVTQITFTVDGARGGITPSTAGPAGGRVVVRRTVVPGDSYTFVIGQQGKSPSGITGGGTAFNGGGAGGGGGTVGAAGAGGGGASDIRFGGTALANRIIVAGGGGGRSAGGLQGGIGGASIGGNGISSPAATSANGKGGTQAAGGARGNVVGSGALGTAGASGVGGTGGAGSGGTARGAGGGGGGYFGGGGGGGSSVGGQGGGGGGGSSFIATTNQVAMRNIPGGATSDNGQIIVSYVIAPFAPSIQLPLSKGLATQLSRQNLCKTPNFLHASTFDWESDLSGVIDSVNAGTHTHSKSLEILFPASTASGKIVASYPFDTTPGETYTATVDVRRGTNAPTAQISLLGGILGSITQLAAGSGTFETLTVTFVATDEVSRVAIISTSVSGGATSAIWVDSALFEHYPVARTYFDPDINISYWTGTVGNSLSDYAFINPDYNTEFHWTFNQDINPSIYTTHYDSNFRYRLLGDPTWITINGVNQRAVGDDADLKFTLTGVTFLDNSIYEFQIQDRNSNSTTFSPWSVSAYLTTPPRPTAPVWVTPVNGGTVAGLPLKIQWTSAAIGGYQVQQLDPSGDILWDSGLKLLPVHEASISPTGLGLTATMRLRVFDGTMNSNWTSISVIFPATLQVPIDDTIIELEVYDGLTGMFIDTVPSRMEPTYISAIADPQGGAGSFKILKTATEYVRSPTLINNQNIVRVKIGGLYVGFYIITGRENVIVGQGEEAEEAILVKGTNAKGAWLKNATLFPERGSQDFQVDLPLVRPNRMFGAGSGLIGNWYNPTKWTDITMMSAQSDTTDVSVDPISGVVSGNPWVGFPTNWDPQSADAIWIWGEEARNITYHSTNYMWLQFDVTDSLPIQLQIDFAAAGNGTFLFDGDIVAQSSDFRNAVQSEVFWASPGTHTLAIITTILGTQPNPDGSIPSFAGAAGVLWAIYKVNVVGSDTVRTPILKSGFGMQVQDGPVIPPSWTPGDLFTTLYQEARNRGVTVFELFELGFDEWQDSKGDDWLFPGVQWEFPMFSTYDTIADRVGQLVAETWFDENLFLQSAPQKGEDRTIVTPYTSFNDAVTDYAPTYAWRFDKAVSNVPIPPGLGPTTLPSMPDDSGLGYLGDLLGNYFNHATYGALTSPLVMNGLRRDGSAWGQSGLETYNAHITDWSLDAGLPLTPNGGYSMEIFATNYGLYQFIAAGLGLTPEVNGATVALLPRDSQFDLLTVETSIGWPNGTYNLLVPTQGHNPIYSLTLSVTVGSELSFLEVYLRGQQVLAIPFNNVADVGQVTVVLQDGLSDTPFYSNEGWGYLSIYNRPLDEFEVLAHWRAGLGNYPDANPVTFAVAKNVLNSGETSDFTGKTAMQVRSGAGIFETTLDPDTLAKYGRIESYLDATSSSVKEARKISQQSMLATIQGSTGNTLDILSDYVPWRDFTDGDWVRVPSSTPGVDYERRRIMSVSASEDANTGRVIYAIELDSVSQEVEQRLARWMSRALPGGDLSGLIANAG